MKKHWHWKRRHLTIAVIVLLAYVGTYSLLSWNGRYFGRPSGEIRYDGGLAAFDTRQWHPYGVCFERRRSVSGEYITDWNELGLVFAPMVYVDRRLVHKTERYFEVPENEWTVRWW